MSTKSELLAKQLEELKKIENAVLNSLSGCDNPTDAKKTLLWNSVIPHLRSGIESQVKQGNWNREETKGIIFDKIMKLVFGEDILDNLGKM